MKEIDLRDPKDCRWYVDNFHFPQGRASFVETSEGRRINFNSMSDEDAIFVANWLFKVQVEGTQKQKKRMIDEGGIVQ